MWNFHPRSLFGGRGHHSHPHHPHHPHGFSAFDDGRGFFGGPGPGGRGGRHGGRGRSPDGEGPGRRGGRVFGQGGLKLLVLSLLESEPRHGYEVIKALEQLVGGDYSPSPGAIYPTLAYLADMGHAIAIDSDGGRKQYRITDEGKAHLDGRRDELAQILGQLDAGRSAGSAGRAPELQRAMGNLRTALQLRFAAGAPDTALSRQVAEILDRAAVEIERL